MKTIYLTILTTLILFSQEIKIASYNVDNLFDNINNGTEYEDYKLNTHNWNSSIFRKKLKNITKVICKINADVIGLQEIENSNALKLLQKSLKRTGCEYRYSAITNKKSSAIQVALLSKIKIKNKRVIRVSYYRGYRDILEVELDTKPPLTIFVNHWHSKRAAESTRVKSAKALIKRIKKMPKNKEYIILGDFNSRYNECINIEDKFNDTNGVCGIDRILHTYYHNKFLKLRDKAPLDIYHYNLWSELAPYNRWSYEYYGKKSAIDSIIISPNLNDNKNWHYKKGSFGVFKDGFLFHKNHIYRWEYKNSKHTGKGYSDHLPIYAIFSNEEQIKNKKLSFLEKLLHFILPRKKDDIKEEKPKKITNLKNFTINKLASKSYAKNIILKDACVVFKRGDIGVVKSSKNSKAIMLYKCAEETEEGSCYNLLVHKKKRYYNIDEIISLDIIKKIKTINPDSFIKKFNAKELDSYYVGDIVSNIRGVYKNRHLNVNGVSVKLYSKVKRKGLFKKGSKLFIKKAQIGYYKGEKELVIYSLKDIIKEN